MPRAWVSELDWRRMSPSQKARQRFERLSPRRQLEEHRAGLARDPELQELCAKLRASTATAEEFDALDEEVRHERLERRWREYQSEQDHPRVRTVEDMLCDVIDMRERGLDVPPWLVVAVARLAMKQITTMRGDLASFESTFPAEERHP